MLATLTSEELSEWMAYERVAGYVDGGIRYMGELLAQLHELTQRTHHLMGAAHFTAEGEENPIGGPIPVPRPWEKPDED